MPEYNLKTDNVAGDPQHPKHHNDMATAVNELGLIVDTKAVLPSGTNGQVLKHNGTEWAAGTDNNTTYATVTQANIENSSSTTASLITGQRFAQGFAARLAAESLVRPASASPVTVTSIWLGTEAQLPATGTAGVLYIVDVS